MMKTMQHNRGSQAGFAGRRVLAWVAGILAGTAVAFLVFRSGSGPLPGDQASGDSENPAGGSPASNLSLQEQYPELTEIGTWLRDYVTPSTVIYAGEPISVKAAGAVYRPLPKDTYENTLNTVVRDKGDFVILHQQVAASTTPSLVPLTNDKSVAYYEPRLSVVKVIPNAARNVVVFRVVRPGGPDSVRTEKVAIAFSRWMAHGPNHAWHGQLAMRKGRYRSAAIEFEHALQADSTNTGLLNNYAWCLLKANLKLDEAEKHARAAVAGDPANPDFMDTLIEVLRARGKTEEAAQLAKRLASMPRPAQDADETQKDGGQGKGQGAGG